MRQDRTRHGGDTLLGTLLPPSPGETMKGERGNKLDDLNHFQL